MKRPRLLGLGCLLRLLAKPSYQNPEMSKRGLWQARASHAGSRARGYRRAPRIRADGAGVQGGKAELAPTSRTLCVLVPCQTRGEKQGCHRVERLSPS